MALRRDYAKGDRGAAPLIGTHGSGAKRKGVPPASEEIRGRARELWNEEPGAVRRIAVRIFREYGHRYAEETIRRWCLGPR